MAIELDSITSGYSTEKINNNFQKLEEEINNNLLRRDGLGVGEGNQMENPLDMNSFDIMNVNNLDVQGLSVKGQSVDGYVEGAKEAAIAAAQSEANALVSENNASDHADYAEAQAVRAEAAADSSDAVILRADLASTDPEEGAALVGRGVVAVDSIADLITLPLGALKEDLRYVVASYYGGWNATASGIASGGGEFVWSATGGRTADNGVVFDGVAGQFFRVIKGTELHTDWYGPDKTGVDYAADKIIAAKQYAEDNGLSVLVNNGTYSMLGQGLTFEKPIKFMGESRAGTVFSFTSALSSAAIGVAQSAVVVGARIGRFTCNGSPSVGSIGLSTGASISISCTDSIFEDMRFFNFALGLKQRYSWANKVVSCRFQSCTKPFELGSQVNATTYDTCSFVTFTSNGTFSNCEGLEFISPNISNFSESSTGVGFSLFQSNVVMTNPYFENVSATIASVGGSSATVPSSLGIVGGIANPGKFSYATLYDRVEIDGVRVQSGGGAGITVGSANSGTAPDQPLSSCKVSQFGNARDQINPIYDYDASRIQFLAGAYGGSVRSWTLTRDFWTMTQTADANGFTVASGLVVGQQYTLVAAIRKTTDFPFSAKIDSLATLGISGVPVGSEDFELLHFYFTAPGTTLRWLYQGTMEVKRLALYEGIVETSQEIPPVRRWKNSAAPTVGTWVVGDIVDNSAPAVGQPKGWVCTVAGTPGTWVSVGNL